MTASPRAHFELSFSPNLTVVNLVRKFIHSFYQELFNDRGLTARVSLATHELLENAVRYSTAGTPSLRIDVEGENGQFKVTITTRNQTDPKLHEPLKALFAEIQTVTDPLSFYQALIHRSSRRADGSGLGLGRVLAESEMRLEYEINGSEIHVCATAMGVMPAREVRS